ncbi:C15orf41-like protein [Sarcoptes scabiei]|uniref:CDAN1-interacting nuclease 1 n=1 Tax=Sarcoptes scabiei TaxID=52283 RepID=A0A131ZX36_SARSC|nr:C15orf41-like protein [Sarcoptes scabiei]
MTEEELRAKNYDVTPDFRLNLPLILFEIEQERPINDSVQRNERKSLCLSRCQDFQKKHLGQWNESNDKLPMMITWIECKAFFASTECHKEYYQNQYYSYINRFGDGLVLYKYGFVDEIPKNFLQNIHIAEKLPIFKFSIPITSIFPIQYDEPSAVSVFDIITYPLVANRELFEPLKLSNAVAVDGDNLLNDVAWAVGLL